MWKRRFLTPTLKRTSLLKSRRASEQEDVASEWLLCKLLKDVYGIVQASRCWTQTFAKSLDTKDLKQSKVDPCLFLLCEGDKNIKVIRLIVNYVNDGIIAGKKMQ